MMEFHISRRARDRYQFAGSLFSYTGNVVFADLSTSREFAHRMNMVRDVQKHPELAVHAGALYAMGLIDEASHVLMQRYREQFDPTAMTDALLWFSEHIGPRALDKMLLAFVEQFPGSNVYRAEQSPQEWLAGSTEGSPHRAVALEEMMLLWMANHNNAFRPFEELFKDKDLAEHTAYREFARGLPEYFATRPLVPLGDSGQQNLFDLLRAPAVAAPSSLREQLDLVRTKWGRLLGGSLDRLLSIAGDVLHEEDLAIWRQFNPPTAAAEAAARAAAEAAQRRREREQQQWPAAVVHSEVPQFGDPAHEFEKFSPDVAWMPGAVMIAKNTYVWLAQLSKQYGRPIYRLDHVPDEELDMLARRGMNTLWLIGIWERSRASQTIKQLCGNPNAVASAYSIFDYNIAGDLGGEPAYVNLRDRAYRRGIRLASDMVPNHMGIDSPWVVEHPDWFLSQQDPPYPIYKFDGPDLSQDPRVEIKIESHYYEQTDAAVVFQRRDRASGETRYIYHGNDGTSFPWNDTAQLNYLDPAVREQVIQTILHVAHLFPVIRFDAAMTLAKRHFHRLWFPGPGSSGAVPSRAEYGMTNAEFDNHMPHEFWREVVDRVANEVPGTLLLAEAFWLMEGYFVRTLGMHRVYNSAFMNMMRDEENAKYRMVLKNTLEFDPDIMKRYVNFMSNPDERTVVDQFGDGDKCFGVTAMLATLPGLPMFGHGQVEGFNEKYGMEYRGPRYDETPNQWLVERHEREIAPLLHQRDLFAESSNFLLYDFYNENGTVDENVFAYSNRRRDQRGLVLYNNRYSTTKGSIDWSAAYADKQAGQLRQQRLKDGMGLNDVSATVLAYRDSLTGLEYLQRTANMAEHGLSIELHAYQCHIFLDWRELRATADKPWDRLCDHLNGLGVHNLEDALVSLLLRPVHDALCPLLDPALVRTFAGLSKHVPADKDPEKQKSIARQKEEFFAATWERSQDFLREAQAAYQAHKEVPLTGQPTAPALLAEKFRERLLAVMTVPALDDLLPMPWTDMARRLQPDLGPELMATAIWGPVLSWCLLELLAGSVDAERQERAALDLFDRLHLRDPLAHSFAALGLEGEECWRMAAQIKVALLVAAGVPAPVVPSASVPPVRTERTLLEGATVPASGPFAPPAKAPPEQKQMALLLPHVLWDDADVRWLTGVHEAHGRTYFLKGPYEELIWWLQLPVLLRFAAEATLDHFAIAELNNTVQGALEAAATAGYCLDVLLEQDKAKTEAE